MYLFPSALVAATIACLSWSVSVLADSSPLSLSEAITATLKHNPQLTAYQFRINALAGEQQTAALKPPLQLSTQFENIAGSGGFKGVDAAELTLALSSVIELDEQRDARLGVISARQQQLDSAQRLLTLDLLTQVTQQFIALAAVQEQLLLLQQTRQFAQESIATLSRQVQAGRTSEAELLRAKAGLARVDIAMQKNRRQFSSEGVKLSAYWADTQPTFTQVKADLFALPPALSLSLLSDTLDSNPDLAVLGDEVYLRGAELRQAQATGKSNPEWNAGVRRLQASDDAALIMGISIPLGASGRASGATVTARANQALAQQEQDSARIRLHAQLVSLHGDYQQALAEVKALRNEVLPALKQAMAITADGFNQGRYSYLELHLAQRELLDTQLALIDAAVRVHLLSSDIERLTGAALNRDAISRDPINSSHDPVNYSKGKSLP